jgi:hypothetical protein
MQEEDFNLLEVDKTVNREQRIAEDNARQSKMICRNLVEEICSGIIQKAVVMDWLKVMFQFLVVIFRFRLIIFWFCMVIFPKKWNENSCLP